MAVLDAGAEEVRDLGDTFEVVSEPADLVAVRTALQDAGIDYDSAEAALRAERAGRARRGRRRQGVPPRSTPSRTSTTCRTSTPTTTCPTRSWRRSTPERTPLPPRFARSRGTLQRGRRMVACRAPRVARRPARPAGQRLASEHVFVSNEAAWRMRVLGDRPGTHPVRVGRGRGPPGRPAHGAGGSTSSAPPPSWTRSSACWSCTPRVDRAGCASTGRTRSPIERVFTQNNKGTAMGTAQAAGVAPWPPPPGRPAGRLHTPSEVKAAITGNGRADKAQVTSMVTRMLRLDAPPKPADAADALALAICHVWRGAGQHRLRRRARRRHRCAGRPARTRWTGSPMIASVRGRVAAVGPDGAVVEVGGVGLAVSCTPGTLARLRVGEQARLATSLVVREDSLTLYGFADDDERAACSSCCRPPTASGRSSRRPCWRPPAARGAPRHRHRATSRR